MMTERPNPSTCSLRLTSTPFHSIFSLGLVSPSRALRVLVRRSTGGFTRRGRAAGPRLNSFETSLRRNCLRRVWKRGVCQTILVPYNICGRLYNLFRFSYTFYHLTYGK
ncbi:hypothetical protein Mapa_014625 [Marchantia paleacea]|nr:hypothetical protein Mapa_014625 [Marchantia paleacea]